MRPAGRKQAELFASAFLVALAAAASVGAYRVGLGDLHTPGPGFMPLATAFVLGLMALGQLLGVALATREHTMAEGPFATSRWTSLVVVLGTVLGFGFVLERVGLSVTVFLMLLVLFGVVARKRWWVTLLSSALTALIVRVAARALGMQFPEGPFGL
jgi:hypothetical protein